MTTIKKLRNEIDKIDASIIKKISQRNKLSNKIGQFKSKLNKKIVDKKREQQLMLHYQKLCHHYQLNPKFIKQLFKLIIRHSRGLQK